LCPTAYLNLDPLAPLFIHLAPTERMAWFVYVVAFRAHGDTKPGATVEVFLFALPENTGAFGAD
jgi:hypothetical protein